MLNNRWIVFFLILPHLNIYYFTIDNIQPLMYIWQSMLIIIALILINKHLTKFLVLFLIYIFVIIMSSFLQGWLTPGIAFKMITMFGLCVYISYCFKNFRELITGLFYLMSLVAIVNLISMVTGGITVNQNGNPVYFLGGKNAITIAVLPIIPIIYIYSHTIFQKLKLIPFSLILVCVVSIFLSNSGTGIVIGILSLIFIFSPIKVFSSFSINMIVYSLLFFSLVVFRLHDVLFGNFITNVLNKDLTLTGRTYIWDIVISNVRESWLIGLGRGNDILSHHFSRISETHNGILEILMDSGIVGLGLFIIILFLVGKRLVDSKSKISYFLSFSIFSYMVIGLTESVFNKKEFWILLLLAYGINYIPLREKKLRKSIAKDEDIKKVFNESKGSMDLQAKTN